jgi:phosphohistidine phosphatase
MLLYFLRHGDAIQKASLDDSERPLSELGRKQATVVGEFLRTMEVTIDVVVSSRLVRAVETAEIVRKGLDVRKSEATEYLVPGTRKKPLLDLLNSMKVSSIILVGHEPHLSQTISLLLSEEESLPIEMKKCSHACLVASDPVRGGHALLQWLLTVEHMEKLRH